MPRDLLLPALVDGKVDLVAAMLTVTPERQKLVDFTRPTRTGVREIVVTGPGVPAVKTIDDLAGRDVFVRRSSSYYDSLTVLNTKLEAQNRPPVTIKLAPEVLEDDDILEMVNAGLVGVTIVDDYIAEFWRQIFTGLTLHPDIAVRSGGTLAVAVRKNNPKLKAAGNIWIDEYGPRTMFGNTVNRRYLENTSYARSATSEQERKKFQSMVQIFRRYGEQYDLDFVMMAAQGYQESRLDQSVRSPVGAIGVMQVMPSTGKELGVGDIRQLEPNIHAGVKYIRFIIDEYFKGEPMDDGNKLLFAFASYNVGPGRIGQLRRETARRGLDPNRWFGNVEQVASERIGREPVQYVSNIYKYYVAYRLVLEQATQRNELKQSPAPAVKR
jgi:membrane-bound lytic murein transglycosylase MltF